MGESVLREKSYAFAIRIVEMNRFLCVQKKEYVLSKQVLRSGTAIGALIHEAEFGQSTPDFRTKLTKALKEANETTTGYGSLLIQIILTSKHSRVFRSIVWNL